jgi:hypothetical protein
MWHNTQDYTPVGSDPSTWCCANSEPHLFLVNVYQLRFFIREIFRSPKNTIITDTLHNFFSFSPFLLVAHVSQLAVGLEGFVVFIDLG